MTTSAPSDNGRVKTGVATVESMQRIASAACAISAIASMSVGLGVTLVLESLNRLKWIVLPPGVAPSGLALILSLLTFFAVSWLTRDQAAADLDADVRLIMEA